MNAPGSPPRTYAFPPGGLPEAGANPEGRAVFTPAYAFLPADTMRDITTTPLPGWQGSRFWIIARPMTGFAETFAQYAGEVAPGGGSDAPEPDRGAEAVLLIASGTGQLSIAGQDHALSPGTYAYIPPGTPWRLHNSGTTPLQFHWIRKRYQPLPGIAPPAPLITRDQDHTPIPMPISDKWATTRFVDPAEMAHDMHVNIVTFQPGGRIPFAETHNMEHGLYVLQGTARYLLNRDWVEVGPGDFMWLRAFCPQACIATGTTPFRYLLYKDMNRHPELVLP